MLSQSAPDLGWISGPALSGASQPGLPAAQVGGLAVGAVQAANRDWKEMDRPKTKMMAMINKRDFFKILGVILIVFKYY